MTEPLLVHRCARCGRWSHAKRKPRFHIRSVIDAAEDDYVIHSATPVYGIYDGDVYESDPGGYLIRCGPFESFEAVKLQ